MPNGRIWTGTSGYSYPEWKGAFYPEKLAQKNFLQFYAQRLTSVEINNTFYRFPGTKLLQGWTEQTPDGFTLAVKAVRKITHDARLQDVGDLTIDFVERCRTLGDKLGPILFQLPPNLRRDDDRLDNFLIRLPASARYAIEFRHESWFDDAVFDKLASAGVALCVSEGEKLDTPRRATADYCYVRLRKDAYDRKALTDWKKWIQRQTAAGCDVYAYLKHDDDAQSPEHALSLLQSQS